jgi:hypothetical protein
VGNFFLFSSLLGFYLSIMIEGKEENIDSISFGRGAVDIQIHTWDIPYNMRCKFPLHFFSLATRLWTLTCTHIFTIPSSLTHTCTGVSANIDCVQHSRFVLKGFLAKKIKIKRRFSFASAHLDFYYTCRLAT